MSSQGTKNQRQEQAAATRQKLLTSAQHLFAQNGYKGTTVRMINRSVDLADGLLYHYFPGGKKEIFKELDEVVKEGAILASNTSSLSITDIAASTNRQENVPAAGCGIGCSLYQFYDGDR